MKEGRRVNRRQTTDDRRQRIARIAFTVVCCLWSVVCVAQTKYPFIHEERNEIVGDKVLNGFFEKLYQQKTQNNQRINVLQIGDSHIQADFLSAQVRTNFQKNFGNAGRGLVVPIKVAGSNEPFNYRFTSNIKCYGKRCVYIGDSLDYGIGGFVVKTSDDTAQFRIRTFDYGALNYSFHKITLFYQQDSSYNFSIEDTSGNLLASIQKDSSTRNVSTTTLSINTNDIILKAHRNDSSENSATLYGLNLENDSNGIIYHAIGVNGAEAFQYVHAKYFAEQTQMLHPDLLILSLGTNEANRRPFNKELTAARLDSLVKQLQLYNPNTPILLTTPPDSYYGRKYYNPAVSAMHVILVDYSKEHDLAVWDLFSASGGFKSCYQWKKYKLMRKDGVHFSRAGYELQGNLLYEALMKSYNKYVNAK
ncbi:MAG: GDSL-type esterase/lipase family protein [Bacteroidetes bacterium]|nr:GDSL-type esterase/lipase family protein [Bacteroidota bacterium]